jgi:hypothetical protein
MKQKSRQASKASMISSVAEEVASTNDRVLLYPKGSITISLDIPRSKSMFVIVKVRQRECNRQNFTLHSSKTLSMLIAKLLYFFASSENINLLALDESSG